MLKNFLELAADQIIHMVQIVQPKIQPSKTLLG